MNYKPKYHDKRPTGPDGSVTKYSANVLVGIGKHLYTQDAKQHLNLYSPYT